MLYVRRLLSGRYWLAEERVGYMALFVIMHNDATGQQGVGNYNCWVLVGNGSDAGSHRIAEGRVEGHQRADGWKKLVQLFLDSQPDDVGPSS